MAVKALKPHKPYSSSELRKLLGVSERAIKRPVTANHFVRKFRLYPTDEQVKELYQYAGNTRFVYNRLLEMNSDAYAAWKKD